MTAPDFLDTNVFVYAYDPSDPQKQAIARDLVRSAIAGNSVTSVQVLAELAATLLHKLAPAADMVRRAVEMRAEYGLHFWDGMIVAAAERGGCRRIWSEDLNAGQTYFGIAVENLFR